MNWATSDKLLEVPLLALGNNRLLRNNLLDEFVDIGSKWLRELLCAEIEQVDRLGLLLAVATDVFQQDSGRVVAQKEPFQFHLNIDYRRLRRLLLPANSSRISFRTQ